MAYLGAPCPCGGALTESDDVSRTCDDCGRHFEKMPWGWCQMTPKDEIRSVQRCRHKRVVGQSCPHCPDSTAQ